jgi:hypothetical protein
VSFDLTECFKALRNHSKKDRQGAYYLTESCVRDAFVAVEKQNFTYFCVWGGGGGERARAYARLALIIQHENAPLFCHLQPLWLHLMFGHYLMNCTIFEKKLQNTQCVLVFSTSFI